MHAGARVVPAEDHAGADSGVERPGDGQNEALCLETLYRDEAPRLLRSLANRMSSREDARDLVGEIFCRMARLASNAAPPDRPQAYLSRMAMNLLADRARKASRQMQSSHVPADSINLAAADPQRLLEARDMLSRVEAAMLKLRPKTREIFMAHRIDGLSYAQIAERTGLSVKGVEKQMSKAIAQIDRLVDRG